MDAIRFDALTAGIADGFRDILVRFQESRDVTTELEVLVVRLYQNLGLYRA